MARKKAEKEEDTGAGLMVMMVSLNLILLIFFIFLNSIGANDEQRIKKALGSLAGRFGLMPGGMHLTPGDQILLPGSPLVPPEVNSFSLATEIRSMVSSNGGLNGEVHLLIDGANLIINVNNNLLFSPGSADLRSEAVPVLKEISVLLKNHSFPIRIEGHTDNQAIATSRYPSNWELSAARAASVLRNFVETQDFSVSQLSAVGFGPHRPLVPNDSAANRTKNRRVEIVILKGNE